MNSLFHEELTQSSGNIYKWFPIKSNSHLLRNISVTIIAAICLTKYLVRKTIKSPIVIDIMQWKIPTGIKELYQFYVVQNKKPLMGQQRKNRIHICM